MDEQFIGALLGNACGMGTSEDYRLFTLDLHCNEIWIVAKLNTDRTKEAEAYRYDILGWKLRLSDDHTKMATWALGFAPFDSLILR